MLSLLNPFGNIKRVILTITAVSVAAVFVMGHLKIKTLENTILENENDILIYVQNEKELRSAIDLEKKASLASRLDFLNIQERNKELNTIITSQSRELAKLRERFKVNAKGVSRDFGDISRAKPGLVKKIINKGTRDVNRCFELATGADLKEKEKNNECKSLTNN